MSYRFFRALKNLDGKKFDTLDELLAYCGMDFSVELRDLIYKDGNNNFIGQPYASGIVRTDNDVCVGIGSTIYGVVQYRNSFGLCEGLLNTPGVTPVYGGAPNLGERAFLTFRSEGEISLGNNRKIVNHFVVMSSHDGSSKITVTSTPIESGGLVFNLDAPIIAIKHSKKANDKVSEAKLVIDKTSSKWHEFSDNVRKLVNVKVTDDEARLFIKAVVGDNDSTRAQNIRDKIYDISKLGVSRLFPSCSGTLFGLVLACVEWADNHQTVRASKYFDEETATLNAKLIGDGATKKAKAWGTALTMQRNRDKLKISNAA